MSLILAPLRGVTIRCFRETFAPELAAAGFAEAVTPFISAMAGVDPLKDRELGQEGKGRRKKEEGRSEDGRGEDGLTSSLRVTPQFIGKDPAALRFCLARVKSAGYDTADLNCGCPFPMVRNKGRGSGLLRTPDVLRQMLEVGCAVMGPGRFSVKARLGVERTDELLKLMPLFNAYPLRFLTVHARTARQMYEGPCDEAMRAAVEAVARIPVVRNGDLGLDAADGMVGRAFVRSLGARPDARDLLLRYVAASAAELSGDRPVLGRIKELVSYWKDLPSWRRTWQVLKICRTVDELRAILRTGAGAACPGVPSGKGGTNG